MAQVGIVLSALPRIHHACETKAIAVPAGARSVTRRQARILTYLDTEDPVMVTELAEFAGVTPSTMSLTLTRLEDGGLVARQRDPEDRRVMNVRLTDVGAQVRDRFSELDPARVDAMLGMLRPEDRRRAVDGLSLLADAADALISRTDAYVSSLTGGRADGEAGEERGTGSGRAEGRP